MCNHFLNAFFIYYTLRWFQNDKGERHSDGQTSELRGAFLPGSSFRTQ